MFIRSDDGGGSWFKPKHRIANPLLSPSATPPDSYKTVFHLAALHPRESLTLYATVSLVAPHTEESNPSVHELDALFISRDGGDSWEKLSEGVRNGSVIGISPINPSVVFAHGKKGTVRSDDGGRTWNLVPQYAQLELRPLTEADKDEEVRALKGPYGFEIYQFVLDPANEKIVYIASNKGLLKTTDGGDSWCLLNLGFDEVRSVHSLAINPIVRTEILVGTSYGLFLSSDGGCHFKKLDTP
jgi:photosystem II stability/assembly factor-like uncharacterized protein